MRFAVAGPEKQKTSDVTAQEKASTPPWKERFASGSGDDVPALVTADEVRSDPERDIGVPGEFPYTRGIRSDGYRGRLWTMRQFAGFGTAADTNRRFHYLLDQGQTGLSVAFDLPTLYGYDCDHEMSRGFAYSSCVELTAHLSVVRHMHCCSARHRKT